MSSLPKGIPKGKTNSEICADNVTTFAKKVVSVSNLSDSFLPTSSSVSGAETVP